MGTMEVSQRHAATCKGVHENMQKSATKVKACLEKCGMMETRSIRWGRLSTHHSKMFVIG